MPSPNDARSMPKSPSPFVRIYNALDLNGTGEYYLGIKMKLPNPADLMEDPNHNYTLRTWEVFCKQWDSEQKKWSLAGCRVSFFTIMQNSFFLFFQGTSM